MNSLLGSILQNLTCNTLAKVSSPPNIETAISPFSLVSRIYFTDFLRFERGAVVRSLSEVPVPVPAPASGSETCMISIKSQKKLLSCCGFRLSASGVEICDKKNAKHNGRVRDHKEKCCIIIAVPYHRVRRLERLSDVIFVLVGLSTTHDVYFIVLERVKTPKNSCEFLMRKPMSKK